MEEATQLAKDMVPPAIKKATGKKKDSAQEAAHGVRIASSIHTKHI